jgi:hypothetical protein
MPLRQTAFEISATRLTPEKAKASGTRAAERAVPLVLVNSVPRIFLSVGIGAGLEIKVMIPVDHRLSIVDNRHKAI